MKIFAKSFAKVNPHLEITGTREDGYHELEISYLSVNLADRLTYEEIPGDRVEISTDASIPTEENLCYRVAKELKGVCSVNSGTKITLEKNIPIGGGLGGGSSNAATTLIALNRLWGCGLSRDELINIGRRFGADIPFFFYGSYCIGGGTGSEVRRMKNPYQDRLIPIITPDFSQLTGEVYSEYDRMADNPGSVEKKRFEEKAREESIYEVKNDLQEPALRLHPDLSGYLDLLNETSEVITSGISGSGSSVFGVTRAGISPELVRKGITQEFDSVTGSPDLKIASPTASGQLIKEGE